ncbi:bromodomain containing protein [Nitzschia inconspicua]|uniref:Bromodomain containing protein n=1 Tax=Nitzschia inconspicua TaxID=303405 RepID=A0A9K3L5F2_9STRA|nr:bromodomain containing protein [Nitzschia inconspicua]
MADKTKMPAFSIGPKAQREVRNALAKSRNPAETINQYQTMHSLHSMFAKAFGTTPMYAAVDDVEASSANNNGGATRNSGRGYATLNTTSADKNDTETLDTDSVLKFLGHLGVSQYEVYKRVSDSLQKQLEDELRKVTAHGPLLHLLQNCWPYATANAEFRPILWAVLRQLGEHTPLAVLQALAERDKKNGQLKHIEIFRPLPPLLKRLCWEADWTDKVPAEQENNVETTPKQYLKMVQSTLLYETLHPLIESYTSTPLLVDSSDKFFVHSTLERRIHTSQRRALVNTTSIAVSAATGATPGTATSILGKTGSSKTNESTGSSLDSLAQAGRAVSQIRNMLSDTKSGSASYRPLLLHAIVSMLMARHGALASASKTGTEQGLLAGQTHLHCTLLADILLSTSGPLPKEFANIHSLARVLDDAVARGVFTDKDLLTVQQTLKLIYSAEQCVDEDNGNNDSPKKKKQKTQKEADGDDEFTPSGKSSSLKNMPNKSLVRQLNQIIISGLTAMKGSDPQSLFLNPVTDAIAPGYSKIIKKPMSISTMERKIEHNQYASVEDWEADVRLMFKNCVDYNKGDGGLWFRGEAKRQLKLYTDEILPQAKNLYTIELQKRNFEENAASKGRKQEEEKSNLKIAPLDPITKTRKVEAKEYTLSMPAVAGMLLADPFVIRILLDRILRSIRLDTNKGAGIPAEHQVVPSLMQILFLAQWSPSICAIRGRQFIVSESGLVLPKTAESPETLLPYTSLRQYLPVMVHLLRDADLDKRLAVGGDLHSVARTEIFRPAPKVLSETPYGSPSQIVLAILEGTYIYVCLPGNSQDVSLSLTFVKFSDVFQQIANGPVWEERSFFKCLLPSILRHKARLSKTVRDVMISTWIDWLKTPRTQTSSDTPKSSRKKRKKGSMESPAHEYLICLLNDWASSFGNQVMPRDLLLKVATEVVEVVDDTEVDSERKFRSLWKREDKAFQPIKAQYERLLALLPETHSKQFKNVTDIDADERDGKTATEVPEEVPGVETNTEG